MRYLLIVVCLLLLGQVQGQQRFKAALALGCNFSQVDGDAKAGFNKIGINAGVIGQISLTPNWELSTEILFSQKGSRSEVSLVALPLLLHFNYAEVPIQINYLDWEVQDADGSTYNKVMLSAGLSVARFVGGRIEYNGLEEPQRLDEYHKNDFSVLIGATYFFTSNWGLNVRWSQSLISINKDNWQLNRLITGRALYMF